MKQRGIREGTFPGFHFISSGQRVLVLAFRSYLKELWYRMCLLFLGRALPCLVSLTTACARQPHEGFDGEWVLDVNAVMLEVELKLKDKVEPKDPH
jgi:hypothetical protein